MLSQLLPERAGELQKRPLVVFFFFLQDGTASLMWSVKSVVTQQTEEEETLAGSPAACSYTLPSQTMTSSLFSELSVCSRRAKEQ